MSRELLKRSINLCELLLSETKTIDFNFVAKLRADIEFEFSKAGLEHEPVAFVDIDRFPPIRWTNNYQSLGDIQPLNGMGLYTTPQDQSARIAELEQQLANLQNREPVLLSLPDVWLTIRSARLNRLNRDGMTSERIARAIEQAVLIANGFKVGDDE